LKNAIHSVVVHRRDPVRRMGERHAAPLQFGDGRLEPLYRDRRVVTEGPIPDEPLAVGAVNSSAGSISTIMTRLAMISPGPG